MRNEFKHFTTKILTKSKIGLIQKIRVKKPIIYREKYSKMTNNSF